LRLDRRGPSHLPADERLRGALAAAFALPVFALVIAESLTRRFGLSRPALLTIALLTGTLAVSALPTAHLDARSSIARPAIADRGSSAIDLPGPTRNAALPVAGPRATSSPNHPEVTPSPMPPQVVRFRPRDGWDDVSRFAAVSVRFTRPMDHASTEEAFHAVVAGRRIAGTFRWAEGDTVLVLVPASALPYGARIALSVELGAQATDGVMLARARSATFTVQPRAATRKRPVASSRPAQPSSGWRWPLVGPITQRFGESLTQYGFHYGIDIDGNTGDPVRAARRGRVVVAGRFDQCGGLEIHVDHGDGISSWYRHLSRIQVDVGSFVEAGAIIGRVGNTGCSLGSHLHFGIRVGSKFVDPLDYLPPR
jgi:murein DD-endopeptidase MepM/ murein hydrolase activator NlpD